MPDNRPIPIDPPTPPADIKFEACKLVGHLAHPPKNWPIPPPIREGTGHTPFGRTKCERCGAVIVLEYGRHAPGNLPPGVTLIEEKASSKK